MALVFKGTNRAHLNVKWLVFYELKISNFHIIKIPLAYLFSRIQYLEKYCANLSIKYRHRCLYKSKIFPVIWGQIFEYATSIKNSRWHSSGSKKKSQVPKKFDIGNVWYCGLIMAKNSHNLGYNFLAWKLSIWTINSGKCVCTLVIYVHVLPNKRMQVDAWQV